MIRNFNGQVSTLSGLPVIIKGIGRKVMINDTNLIESGQRRV